MKTSVSSRRSYIGFNVYILPLRNENPNKTFLSIQCHNCVYILPLRNENQIYSDTVHSIYLLVYILPLRNENQKKKELDKSSYQVFISYL